MDTSDRTALQQWIRHRDAEAFKRITSRHAGMVYTTARRILGNPAEAEEVCQECFELLCQATTGVLRVNSLGAWLHGVATNRSLQRIRSERRRREREKRFSKEYRSNTEIRWDDIYPYVDEAIEQLGKRHQEPVVLHFFEDKTHEMIARQLGVSRTTVTYRIQKGVEAIRKQLKRRGIMAESALLAAMMVGGLRSEAAPQTLTANLARLALAGAGAAGGADVGKAAGRVGEAAFIKAPLIALAVLVLAGFVAWQVPWSKIYASLQDGQSPVQESNTAQDDRAASAIAPSPSGGEDDAPDAIDEAERKEAVMLAAAGLMKEAEPEEPQGTMVGTISGWVVDAEGNAVADSSVAAQGMMGGGQAVSAKNGSFSVDILVLGPELAPSNMDDEGDLFMLSASKESFLPATEIRVPLDAQGVELVLTKQGEIRGNVFDADTGEPIPGTEGRIVRHRDPVEGMMGTAHPWTKFTSPTGEFALPTTYDVGQVAFRAKGYVESRIDLLVLQGEIYEDLAVGLKPAAYIWGTVLDAKTRQPLEGAHVSVAAGHIRQWWGINEGNFATHALSGPDGKFELTQAPVEGYVDIMVWLEGYAPSFLVDVGADSGELKILLSEGGSLKGVVKRNGAPIPGLRMWAGNSFGRPYEHGDESPATPAFLALAGTNENGEYSFSQLPPGQYQIRVMDANPSTPLHQRYLVRQWADILEEETTVLNFDIENESVVSGTVIGLDSVDGVQLRLYDQRYPGQTLYSTEERHDSAKPNEEGYFKFCPVPSGDYYVRATCAGSQAVEEYFHIDPAETIELVIDFGAAASGQEGR